LRVCGSGAPTQQPRHHTAPATARALGATRRDAAQLCYAARARRARRGHHRRGHHHMPACSGVSPVARYQPGGRGAVTDEMVAAIDRAGDRNGSRGIPAQDLLYRGHGSPFMLDETCDCCSGRWYRQGGSACWSAPRTGRVCTDTRRGEYHLSCRALSGRTGGTTGCPARSSQPWGLGEVCSEWGLAGMICWCPRGALLVPFPATTTLHAMFRPTGCADHDHR
jgi:hypothetical protein